MFVGTDERRREGEVMNNRVLLCPDVFQHWVFVEEGKVNRIFEI